MSKADENITDIFQIKQRMVTAIVNEQDRLSMQSIKDYFKEKYPNEYVNITFLDENKVDEIIKLGIAEYKKKHKQQRT